MKTKTVGNVNFHTRKNKKISATAELCCCHAKFLLFLLLVVVV